MTVYSWSQTAASNSNADSTVNWAENQSPSSVNDSARAMMAAIAKWRDDMSGNLVTGGASTAYTLATNQGFTSLDDGLSVTARLDEDCGASPTLNVDALGAKAIRTHSGTAPAAGSLKGGSVQTFTYDSGDDCWYVHGSAKFGVLDAPSGTKLVAQQSAAPAGWSIDTTHNNKAMRIVSGSPSSGGSTSFTSVFTSRTPAGSVGDTTLTINQIPNHGHPFRVSTAGSDTLDSAGGIGLSNETQSTQSAFTGTPSGTVGQQIGGTGGGAAHGHSFTGSAMDFAVQYVDFVVIAKA